MQNAAKDPNYRLCEPGDTRWCSTFFALRSVERDLVHLREALIAIHDKTGEATPAGLLTVFRRPYTIAGVCMMRDATEILWTFSKRLQTRKLTLIQLHYEKNRYIQQLQDICNIPAKADPRSPAYDPTVVVPETFYIKRWPKLWAMMLDEPPSDDVVRNHMDNFHKNVVTPYIRIVWRDIEVRFGGSGLVDAVQIFEEGKRDGLFNDVPSFVKYYFTNSMDELYPDLLYPDLSDALIISCVLPVSSCSVERCFSTMKRIKTRLRSRLTDQNLEWLMLASVEGPDWEEPDVKDLTDEQAEAIIRMFAAMKDRRIPM